MRQKERDKTKISCNYKEGRPARLTVYAIGTICLLLSCVMLLDQFQLIDAHLSSLRNHLFVLDLLARYVEWFCNLWDVKALSSVIRVLGVSGVAFAWLVSAADKEILGVPIRDVLQWLANKIYLFYFFCYIPSLVIGVYAGDSGKTTQLHVAAVFSSLGVVVVSAYLMWLCYALLLHSNMRQRMIFLFYRDQLHACAGEPGKCDPNLKQMELWLLRSVKYYRAVLEDKYQEEGKNMCGLWLVAAATFHKTGQELLNLYYSCQDCPFLDGIEMIEHAWASLLSGEITDIKKKVIVDRILGSMCNDQENEQKGYIILLVGLVSALFHLHEADENNLSGAMEELERILNIKGLPQPVAADLARAFGMRLALCSQFKEDTETYTHALYSFAVKYGELAGINYEDEESSPFLREIRELKSGADGLTAAREELAQKPALSADEKLRLEHISSCLQELQFTMEEAKSQAILHSLFGKPEIKNPDLLFLHMSWLFRREVDMGHAEYWGQCLSNPYIKYDLDHMRTLLPDRSLLSYALTACLANENTGEENSLE